MPALPLPPELEAAILDGAQQLCFQRHPGLHAVCRLCLRDTAFLVGEAMRAPDFNAQEQRIRELEERVQLLTHENLTLKLERQNGSPAGS